MQDRGDGVENRQAKRDRDNVDYLAGTIGTETSRAQSSGHVLANVGIRLVLCENPIDRYLDDI